MERKSYSWRWIDALPSRKYPRFSSIRWSAIMLHVDTKKYWNFGAKGNAVSGRTIVTSIA